MKLGIDKSGFYWLISQTFPDNSESDNIKICSICGENKSLTEYYSYEKESKTKGKYTYYQPYCKECTKKKTVEFQKANPDKRKQYDKKDNAKPDKKQLVKKLNKERRENGLYAEWQRNNPDKLKVYNTLHRTHSITQNEWENCKNYFNYRCAYCNLKIENHFVMFNGKMTHSDFHKEHVNHEGANDLSNCIPSCKSCNCSKWAHSLGDWYNQDNPNFDENRLQKIIKWVTEDYKLFLDI